MRVNDSSIHLSLVQKPAGFRAEAGGGKISMRSSPIQVTVQCQVIADASDAVLPSNLVCRTNPRMAPWKLGFMQVQVLEIAWAYYRGPQDDGGCVLNDTVARRSTKVCRDYDRASGAVWYEGSGNIYDCYGLPDVTRPSPWNLEFYFGDNPLEELNATVLNEQTQRTNYLYEARCAMAFITTLTEQVTQASYRHHRHFLWSVIWHIRATGTEPQKKNTEFKLLPGSGFWISEFKRGGPVDPRYLAVLNNPQLTPSCNQVAQMTPVAKSTASNWQRFPLMDRKDSLFPAR